MYDLLILGAGPAGSTLARLASCLAGLRVLLLDARDLDRPAGEGRNHRVKSCGGLLAPDAQRALARLYGALPAAVLADPQLFAVRAIDLSTGREATYQRFYVNIRREAFDRWLYAQAGQADRVCDATVTGIRREAGGWTVATTDGRSFTGRFLAGADGGHSLVRHLSLIHI